jgi:hypothetical protein
VSGVAEGFDAIVAALRYTLAYLDQLETATGDGELPNVEFELPPRAVPGLAMLVVGARRAFAEQHGITERTLQNRYVRDALEHELEACSFGALTADIETGLGDGGQSGA